uniref:SIR2 family NAD-dependent protein deacylase n=1 Tax=Parolsenella massiliensis TaxID=1871022 RepID=UPI0009328D8B|nr:Sir2 silent information regulator family NAD-dependent deacetylase [Parolsenella massiliensis]
MYFSRLTRQSTRSFSAQIDRLQAALDEADAIIVGAGSGLSTAAGYTYSDERFERLFGDFAARYGFSDMYAGGFYPYDSLEEYWAFWSRYVMCNRYEPTPKPVYERLLALVRGRDYFVITTNVDHCFQRAGFDKQRLFYTQGDYGLFQCSRPCCRQTWDNEQAIRAMFEQQEDLRIPSELVPHCPNCGAPMTMNLRCDDTFVEDEGWHRAASRYNDFLRRHKGIRTLLLELGVGGNTPGIIKYPFWQMCAGNPQATYACINLGEAVAPVEIDRQAILIDAGADVVLDALA